MRTVGVWINVLGVGAEVPAIHVVNVAVAIVINTRSAVKLSLVDADVGSKVFVVVVDTTINDGYNHILATGGSLPRLKEVDVGTGTATGKRAGIVVVPLT